MTSNNKRIEREQKVSKFYSLTGSITKAYQYKILNNSQDAKVIEYGCGKGSYACTIAKNQARLVTSINILSLAIKVAQQQTVKENLLDNSALEIMDTENLVITASSQNFIF
ncbi:MAG: hypothetical protein ACRC2S_23340 [Waterburya sp.]